MNAQFVGQELSGGILAGLIENNSFIGGTIKDIALAKDSVVIGGVMAGQISGSCDNPARLEEVMVKSHSELSCLILGEGVHLQDHVTLQAVQIAVSPPAINPIAPILLPALETVALTQPAATPPATSALLAGGVAVNNQAFQSVVNVTSSDWITVWSQIWSDPVHWDQTAEMVVYGRYAAAHSETIPIHFMLVKDETGGNPQVQSWSGELDQLMAFETVATLSPSHWIPIYEDFLELPAGQLELWFGYRVVTATGTTLLIQNRDGIEIVISEF